MRSTYKYIIAAFFGLGICGGISVEFANGMGEQFSAQDMRDRMNSFYFALKINQDWLINFVQNKLDDKDIQCIMKVETKSKDLLIKAITNCDTNAISLTRLLHVIGVKEGWSICIMQKQPPYELYGNFETLNRRIVLQIDNKYAYKCVVDEPVSQNLSNITLHDGCQKIENIDMSKGYKESNETKEEKKPKLSKSIEGKQEKGPKKKLSKQQDDDISEISFDEDGYSVYKRKDGSKGMTNVYFTDVIKRIKENPNDKNYVIKLFQNPRDAKKSIFTERIEHLVDSKHVYFYQFNELPSYIPDQILSSIFAVFPTTKEIIAPENIIKNQDYASRQILNSIYNLIRQGSFEIVEARVDSITEGYIDIKLTQEIQIDINGRTFNVALYDNINIPTDSIRIAIKVDERKKPTKNRFRITIKSIYPI